MEPYYSRSGITLFCSDNRDILPHLEPESISAVVTDPPYGLTQRANTTYKSAFPGRYDDHKPGVGFMGMKWDGTSIEIDPAFWELTQDTMSRVRTAGVRRQPYLPSHRRRH